MPHPDFHKIPGPRIGFFGLLYEKIDYELLAKVAKTFPHKSLVLIGPIDYCPESIKALPNVHLLGPKPYSELPQWLAGLDVLLLPYVMDEMIRQSNPLKLRECLATGKPTVSVEVPEAREHEPHIRVAECHEDFIHAIRDALEESPNLPHGAYDNKRSNTKPGTIALANWRNTSSRLRQTHFKSKVQTECQLP